MFDKFRFGRQSNDILLKEFNYDLTKLSAPALVTLGKLRVQIYETGGTPLDAAVMFMLIQIDQLSAEARNGAFAQNVLLTVERLRDQMSEKGAGFLPDWIEAYHAETARLAALPKPTFRGVPLN